MPFFFNFFYSLAVQSVTCVSFSAQNMPKSKNSVGRTELDADLYLIR